MANCEQQQLNITCCSDVILNVTLEHEGETLIPELIEDLTVNLISGLGRRTALEASLGPDYIVVNLPWVEGRLPGCYSLELKGSINNLAWSSVGKSLIRYTSATVAGSSTVVVSGDTYDVTMEAGYYYTDSPIASVTASIDNGVGTPSVKATYARKVLDLDFHNLKGNGIASIEQTTESMEDGGLNVVTITDDLGNESQVGIRNGHGIVGPQGIQGESAVFDPETGNILAELEQSTGQSAVNAMTQKAVTDELMYVEPIDLTSSMVTSVSGKYIGVSTKKWTSAANYAYKLVPVVPGTTIELSSPAVGNIFYAFLTSSSATVGNPAPLAEDYDTIPRVVNGKTAYLTAPAGSTYLYILTTYDGGDRTPGTIGFVRGSVKDAVGANEEKLEDLIVYNFGQLPEYNYSFGEAGKFGTSTSYKHTAVRGREGEKFIIKAPVNNVAVIAFATTNTATSGGDVPLVTGTSVMVLQAGHESVYTIPRGCKFILVYNGGNLRPFNVQKLDNGFSYVSTIKPKIMFGAIESSGGQFDFHDSTNKSNFESGVIFYTPRYIKTSQAVSITPVSDCVYVRVFYYTEDFVYMGYSQLDNISAGQTVSLEPAYYNAAYIKLTVRHTDAAYKIPSVSLTGHFGQDWDTFNPFPSAGYKRISVMVNVSDPSSYNAYTQTVQDEPNYLPDYGLIALPPTYTNTGEPTRLIIYCHGAGTHLKYSSTPTYFDTNKHVDPAYWLAEGYAVMDVDGNPFDDTNPHAFMPQAMDSYVAAYQWAIEHYNIKRDGVFLGGRSMGGGNTLNLIRQQCPIPVIAACANLPTSLAMNKDASSKAFSALHRGFVQPDGFSWSTGTDANPYNSAEKQVVLDNWDRFISWTAITHLVIDMPTDEDWKRAFIDSCTLNNYDRITLMQNLHAVAKCPLKMFSCFQDPNNDPETAAILYKKMFANSGQIAELRMNNSYKDYTGTGYTAHYYELQDPALRTDVATCFGEEMTNVPTVYIEMLQFWRRYEQDK